MVGFVLGCLCVGMGVYVWGCGSMCGDVGLCVGLEGVMCGFENTMYTSVVHYGLITSLHLGLGLIPYIG